MHVFMSTKEKKTVKLFYSSSFINPLNIKFTATSNSPLASCNACILDASFVNPKRLNSCNFSAVTTVS